MKRGKFERFTGTKYDNVSMNFEKRYYFRLVALNGRTICQSEGYNTKRSRDKGIAAIKRLAGTADVVDV